MRVIFDLILVVCAILKAEDVLEGDPRLLNVVREVGGQSINGPANYTRVVHLWQALRIEIPRDEVVPGS